MKMRMSRRALVIGSGSMLVAGRVSAQHGHMHDASPEASPGAAGMDHGDVSMGAFYFTVANHGEAADTLVSVQSEVAETIEIHSVTMEGNVMHMAPLEGGLEIPAGETVTLEPGGFHVMLIGLTKSLKAEETFDATLTFEGAGEVEVTVPILASEPKDGEGTADPITAGDLEITNLWARQAPKLDATPMASPTT